MPQDPIDANPQNHEDLPSQADFDAAHEAARTKLASDLGTLGRGPHTDGGVLPPPAPPGYNDVPAASASGGPPPAPAGYADIPAPRSGQGDKPLGEQPASFRGVATGMAHQAGHFLEGLIPDTIKGMYDAAKTALPNGGSVDDDREVKDLIDKKDYLGAAKHLVTKGVESTPGGKFITGAIHNLIDEGGKAVDAFKNGDPASAAAHAGRAVPVVGPLIGGLADTGAGTPEEKDTQGNVTKPAVAGDPARMAGQVTSLLAGPKLLEGAARSIPVLPKIAPKLAPEAASAVRFADDNAIPIDAATRTGDKFVRNVQALAQNQPIASGIATRAQGETRAAMKSTGEQLANVATQPLPATPEEAGGNVAAALAKLSKDQQGGASAAYAKLEKIEADPQHARSIQTGMKYPEPAWNPQTGYTGLPGKPTPVTKSIALPVDMSAAIQQLRPVLDQIKQQMPLAQQQASRGLQAIDNIVNGDRYQPASVADQNLSALKQLQRENLNPKTMRLANAAVNAVAPLVDRAVAGAGPNATYALNEGRALTKAKYATDETIDNLPVEPVQLFNKLTAGKDININLLRDVASKAPASMPALGRANLEGLFDMATSAEGKPGAGTARSLWNKMGDSTKAILYPDAVQRGRINDFINLADQVSRNPNPSGTAHLGSSLITLTEGGVMLHNPVAGAAMLLAWPAVTKMLYSEGGAKLLMTGLRVPVSSKAMGGLVAGSILRAAGGDTKPVAPSAPLKSIAPQATAAAP